MIKKSTIINLIVYISLIIIAFLLPFFSFDGYSLISHTTSHLGAQGSPHAWIMNVMFMLLALTSIYITLKSKVRFYQFTGLIFGMSLFMTGMFRHKPLIDLNEYSFIEDQLHSIFASTTGFSFIVFSFSHGLLSENKQRFVGITIAVLATILSLLMFTFPDIMGILQRIMFLSSFGWLFFYFVPPKKYTYHKEGIKS